MEKLDVASLDIENIEKEKLKSIFPQCFVEGKLNVDKLLNLCGEYIDNDYEKYEFTWKGKVESLKNAQTRSVGTLRPCVEESKNFDDTENLYIEGDNLEVLKLLQHSYYNKIKMIYIDPPYNTGNDFVYKDDFKDSIANYKEITGQATKSNPEYTGRFHTDWLNMIYPRLRLSYNLLTDDGVIFISIDDNEVHNLRKVCDEVFGEENFVSEIIWQKKTGASDSKTIATITEYILVYTKTNLNPSNKFSRNLTSYDINRYKYQDEHVEKRGVYYIDNLDRGGLQYSDSLNFGIKCPDGTITFPNGRTEFFNDGWIWKWSSKKVEWALENNFLEFRKSSTKASGWSVCYKNYLLVDNEGNEIERSAPHKNLITDILNANASADMKKLLGSNFFNYSKPLELIKTLISYVNFNDDDIILDFFSGSATTAHAVMELNAEDGRHRKHIMVQLPELVDEKSEAYKSGYKNICEIGKERIRRAGAKIEESLNEKNAQLTIGEESKPITVDTGFKVFKLDTSNFKVWDNSGVYEDDINLLQQRLEDMIEEKKDGRTDLDIVYEVMLKVGVPLTEKVIPMEITATSVDGVTSSKQAYVVREDCLLIVCLEKGILKEHVVEMLQYDPATIVFSESSFENTEEIVNAKLAMEDVHGFEHKDNVRFMYV